jgi:Fe-S-cluster-containing hydrogenase component 2
MLLLDENKCVGCNVCTLICPISNIEIKNDKAVFKNKCDNCLACLHACPHNSIHVVNQKGEEHYTNPNVSIGEIIRSNRQL